MEGFLFQGTKFATIPHNDFLHLKNETRKINQTITSFQYYLLRFGSYIVQSQMYGFVLYMKI